MLHKADSEETSEVKKTVFQMQQNLGDLASTVGEMCVKLQALEVSRMNRSAAMAHLVDLIMLVGRRFSEELETAFSETISSSWFTELASVRPSVLYRSLPLLMEHAR